MNRSSYVAVMLLGLTACASAPEIPLPRSDATPRLLVFITVDALRPDYFTRFDRQLSGGLARLRGGGAFFINGYQDHALSHVIR